MLASMQKATHRLTLYSSEPRKDFRFLKTLEGGPISFFPFHPEKVSRWMEKPPEGRSLDPQKTFWCRLLNTQLTFYCDRNEP